MLLTLVAGLGLLAAPVLILVFGLTRWRVPPSLALLGVVLHQLVIGLPIVLGARARTASADGSSDWMVEATTHFVTSMYTLFPAGIAATVGLLVCAGAAAAVALLRPGGDVRTDIAGLAGAGLGLLVGAALQAGGVGMLIGFDRVQSVGVAATPLGVCTVLALVGVGVASVRVSEEDPGRAVMLRALAGLSAVGALVHVGYAFNVMGDVESFKAVATAVPEMKQLVLDGGMEIASWSTLLGVLAALVPLCAMLGAAAPHLRGLRGRHLLDLLVGVASLTAILAMPALLDASLNALFAAMS